jgi:hypothetical protein
MILAALLFYQTYIHPRFDPFGYAGELRIAVRDDGVVRGTYRAQDGGDLKQVNGGRQGSKIWFDIATLGGLHIEGTVKPDGSISGMAVPLGMDPKQYVFTATPESNPSP